MAQGEAVDLGRVAAKLHDVIDVERRETWPDVLCELLEAYYPGGVGDVDDINDLVVPEGADDQIRQVLAGHRLRAYHCTRLLDHERNMIFEAGLRPFGPDLFEGRIAAARAHGAITDGERAQLSKAHMYAVGEGQKRGSREGLVSLILGEQAFVEDAANLRPLLTFGAGRACTTRRVLRAFRDC
ncbi:hypothetical protein [Luedemannella helvata]|uniref:HD domain-containing protein n=1 Tax=Luedemannella helvata TaxID=349315 RepID=A0ABP4XG50_9ACTN